MTHDRLGNLFADLPPNLPSELFTRLLDADDVRIERIVSLGHALPAGFWYDQDQHEWVMVLKGRPSTNLIAWQSDFNSRSSGFWPQRR